MNGDPPCSTHVALEPRSTPPSARSATGSCCATACSRARWRPRWAVYGAVFGVAEGEYCGGREAEFARLENHPKILSGKSTRSTNMSQTWREGCSSWHRLQRSLVGLRGCRIRAEGSARCLQIRLHHELDADVAKRVMNIPKGHSTRFHFLVTMRTHLFDQSP